MLKRLVAFAPSPSPFGGGADSRGDPRAGAGQGQRRHDHQDRVRAEAGRRILRQRPELANVSPTVRNCRRRSPRCTPHLILDAVDELLLVQRGRELGYAMSDEQFKSVLDNIKKQNNIDDRRAVPGRRSSRRA